MSKEVRYYKDFCDDFCVSANQNYTLKGNYKWVRKNIFYKIYSAIIYGLAVVFSSIYLGLFLHLRVSGRKKLKGLKGGFFIYGNHTQPIGDVFTPALCVFPKRIYTVVSSANYGIPVINKILTPLGALPISDTVHGLKQLNNAIEYRLKKGNPIVIYPEAHVWEYYTGIRPFKETPFKYQVKFNKPCIVMTVTYKKSKIFKKPIMKVFLDGPYYANGTTAKQKAENLRETVFNVMSKRSKQSDFEYIEYKHIG